MYNRECKPEPGETPRKRQQVERIADSLKALNQDSAVLNTADRLPKMKLLN